MSARESSGQQMTAADVTADRPDAPEHEPDFGLVQDAWVRNYLEVSALEQEYEDLFDLAPCGCVTLTPEGRILRVNRMAATLLGARSSELTGTVFAELCAPDDHPALTHALQQADITGHLQTVDLTPVWGPEQTSRIRVDIRAHLHDGGTLRLWQLSLADVSHAADRIQQLEAALASSELRVRELNHRVGNNLMVLSSLIRLKEHETNGDGHLAEVRHQIEAIQGAHELMRISGGQMVDMRSYLETLLKSISTTLDGTSVAIDLLASDITLLADQAVSVGLIVNELALNAIKHGFADTDQPRFSIRLEKANDGSHYYVEVHNSGAPIPDDVAVASPESLGLRIVSCCVDELQGGFELEKAPHPVYRIRFPATEEAAPGA